jgi:hypothetical protein
VEGKVNGLLFLVLVGFKWESYTSLQRQIRRVSLHARPGGENWNTGTANMWASQFCHSQWMTKWDHRCLWIVGRMAKLRSPHVCSLIIANFSAAARVGGCRVFSFFYFFLFLFSCLFFIYFYLYFIFLFLFLFFIFSSCFYFLFIVPYFSVSLFLFILFLLFFLFHFHFSLLFLVIYFLLSTLFFVSISICYILSFLIFVPLLILLLFEMRCKFALTIIISWSSYKYLVWAIKTTCSDPFLICSETTFVFVRDETQNCSNYNSILF